MNSEESTCSIETIESTPTMETIETIREGLIKFTDRYIDELESVISLFQFELERSKSLSSAYKNLQTDSEILDVVDSVYKKPFLTRPHNISRHIGICLDLINHYKNKVRQNRTTEQVIDIRDTIKIRDTRYGFQEIVKTEDQQVIYANTCSGCCNISVSIDQPEILVFNQNCSS